MKGENTMDENKNTSEDIEIRKIRDEIAELGSDTPKVTKLEPAEIIFGDTPDDLITVPVSEYKHLVKCEAAVDLLFKLLDIHGKYDNTRAEIIEVACKLLQKEGPENAE